MHTVYILGPMTGIPRFNYTVFDAMEDALIKAGHIALNPARHTREVHGFDPYQLPSAWDWNTLPEGVAYQDFIRYNLNLIQDYATAYVALSGWEQSKGATAEAALCRCLGLPRLDPENGFDEYRADTNILHVADRITSKDRREQYGHPADHWRKTTEAMYALMPGLFARKPEPWEWGLMVNIDKMARFTNKPKHDTLVDMTGYPRCIQLVFEHNGNPL